METPSTEMHHLNQERKEKKEEESHENAKYTEGNDDGSIKFQKFVYELFEKNGVLNDLRAHLRGHIISILRTTDDIPKCQKHFVQRLEYPYQAINILIAEYFLRMNFNYSLSVFVTEMPLSNMAFHFAKSLLQLNAEDDVNNLTFSEPDIWSVLRFLGLQIDSEHAFQIRNMYREEQMSLLDCLLKCVKLASLQVSNKEATSTPAQTQLTLDDMSLSSEDSSRKAGSRLIGRAKKARIVLDKCNHFSVCKSCRRQMARLKRTCETQKRETEKITIQRSACNQDMEDFMKNITTVEKNLVTEMFSQMKTVYDAELEMVKNEEQKKVKRSVGSLVYHLQQKKAEMEESYGVRVEELERSAEEKKRFLWGLARGLRAQHENMARAMHHVRRETRRLTHKEGLLKSRILKAEAVIRARGEQVRAQITQELAALAGNLEAVTKEKEMLMKERTELEEAESNYRLLQLSKADNNYEDLQTRYDNLKTEIGILRKCIDTIRTENKPTSETSTNTDALGKEGLNNEQDVERAEERRTREAPNQVVNDLKKLKNVNFSKLQARESARSLLQSTSQTQTHGDTNLEMEYQRLREIALTQRDQLSQLTQQYERLQTELVVAKTAIQSMSAARARPQTAPPRLEPFYVTLHRASTSRCGGGCGGGEQLTPLCPATQPVVVPGDRLPFVGVVGEQHGAHGNRHLLSQWRAMRHLSPSLRMSRTREASPAPSLRSRPNSANPKLSPNADRNAAKPTPEMKQREKNPESFLREAKAKLRNKDPQKTAAPRQSSREHSPTTILREAKSRLRKLQIEAEAVEHSYRDFRRGQQPSRPESRYISPHNQPPPVHTKVETVQHNCEQILRNYSDRYDTYFKNRNKSSSKANPLPKELIQLDRVNDVVEKINEDYLNKPLTEFRKLYQIEKPSKKVLDKLHNELASPNREICNASKESVLSTNRLQKGADELKEKIRREQDDKEAELDILKENINKIYNINVLPVKETNSVVTLHQASSELYKSDVENVCEELELKVSLDCMDDDSESKLGRTELTVNLQSGYMLDCPVEAEVEIGEIVTSLSTDKISFDPNSPMKNTLRADVENFGKQDKLRNNANSEASSQKVSSGRQETNKEAKSTLEDAFDLKANAVEAQRNLSPELEANITKNDALEAIYNSPHEDFSNVEIGEIELDGSGGYGDDFSADVDNYDISKNLERSYPNSPHSMLKSDDNFWDS